MWSNVLSLSLIVASALSVSAQTDDRQRRLSSGWGIDTKAVVDRGDTVEIGAG